MSTIGAADARKQFADVIERAQHEPVVVARRGHAEVVIVSAAEYERMRDALDELEDIAAFDAALAEEGPNLPWAQVKADLGWE
jgi:antitoxin Phd